MNRLELYNQLKSWQGRRNTLLTIIIAENKEINKVLDGIERGIRAIKHDNKRGQIMYVMKLIRNMRLELPKIYKKNGVVICAGYNLQNESFYKEFVPNIVIKENEYYYDYTFNMERIQEVLWNDVILDENKKIEHEKLINKYFNNSDGRLIFGQKEINDAIQSENLRYLYLNDTLEAKELEELHLIKAKVLKLDIPLVPCGIIWH